MASGDYFWIFDDDNYLTSNDYFSKVAEGVVKSINGSQTKHGSNVKTRLIDAVLFQDRVLNTPSVYQISMEERRLPLRRATMYTLWKSLYLLCVGKLEHYTAIFGFSVKRYGLVFTLGNAVFSIFYLPYAVVGRMRLGGIWIR